MSFAKVAGVPARRRPVRIWGVRRNASSSKPSYEVRWVVAGREKSRTRRTKALADSFLSELRQAMKRGESFDTATGLPESMLKAANRTTWYEYVLGYADKRWPGAAAHTRKSMVEALGTVTAALVQDRRPRPDFADLYRVLIRYALPPGSRSEERSPDDALEDEEVVERALAAIALRLDGKATAATVVRRKRAVFYNVLDMAATGKRRILARNPLDTMKWKPPEVAEKVDRRSVVNPRQARELLTALSYVGGRDRDRGRRLVAMFAGRLFRQPNGGVVSSSTYAQVGRAAREIALPSSSASTPTALGHHRCGLPGLASIQAITAPSARNPAQITSSCQFVTGPPP